MVFTYSYHQPVLLPQVINALEVRRGEKYIDATCGGGGYTREILKLGGIVLALDRDGQAIAYIRKHLAEWLDTRLFTFQGNFAKLEAITEQTDFKPVKGIVFDLGMSSYQLEKEKRGFSFERDEPLDMRMDTRQKETAASIINNYSVEELYEIFSRYAEEVNSRSVAHAIVRARSLAGPIISSGRLAQIITSVSDEIYQKVPESKKYDLTRKMKARIFQAVRIAVNSELENIKSGIQAAINLISSNGKLAVVSYHSLEDRIIKMMLKRAEADGRVRIMTPKPIVAERSEIQNNPKAKSAKLRVATLCS